jgi:7-cyano-7-deazaguanine synthase
VIATGTKNEKPILIHTPLIHLTKGQIVEKGMALGAPLGLTWSCYKNERKACGVCESCVLRLRGFAQAGVKDPIPYETAGG